MAIKVNLRGAAYKVSLSNPIPGSHWDKEKKTSQKGASELPLRAKLKYKISNSRFPGDILTYIYCTTLIEDDHLRTCMGEREIAEVEHGKFSPRYSNEKFKKIYGEVGVDT